MALALAKAFGAQVEAVSVYDPHFHQVAFRSIAHVLSEEAARELARRKGAREVTAELVEEAKGQ